MAASMPAQRRSGSSRTTYPDPTGGRTPTGSIAYRALPGARTEGYEIELSGQLPPGWQIQDGYARKVARRSGGKVSAGGRSSTSYSTYTWASHATSA